MDKDNIQLAIILWGAITGAVIFLCNYVNNYFKLRIAEVKEKSVGESKVIEILDRLNIIDESVEKLEQAAKDSKRDDSEINKDIAEIKTEMRDLKKAIYDYWINKK